MSQKLRTTIYILGPIAGLVGSLQQSFMKGFTLSLSNDEPNSLPTYMYLTFAVSLATFQLFTINRMMTIYPQLEIQPIYETSLIVFNMLCGAIILNEKAMYTNMELFILFLYACVCISICPISILGVYISRSYFV